MFAPYAGDLGGMPREDLRGVATIRSQTGHNTSRGRGRASGDNTVPFVVSASHDNLRFAANTGLGRVHPDSDAAAESAAAAACIDLDGKGLLVCQAKAAWSAASTSWWIFGREFGKHGTAHLAAGQYEGARCCRTGFARAAQC